MKLRIRYWSGVYDSSPRGWATGTSQKVIAQHQNFTQNRNPLNFYQSSMDAHLGDADYRAGIHLAQLAMVDEKITI